MLTKAVFLKTLNIIAIQKSHFFLIIKKKIISAYLVFRTIYYYQYWTTVVLLDVFVETGFFDHRKLKRTAFIWYRNLFNIINALL